MSAGVVVIYDGSKQPEHLQKFLRFKGEVFESGKEHRPISPELAGHLLASHPAEVKVVSGTPATWSPGTASAKAAARKEVERQRQWNTDPTRALDGLAPLPPAVLKAVSVKQEEAVKAIEEGAADAHLGNVAVWAQLGNRTDLAKACVLRAETVRKQFAAS